jgi:DNA polymerase-1
MMEVVSEVLIPLQSRGLRVDTRMRDRVVNWYQKREGVALRQLARWVPGAFNPYAPRDVQRLLYETWGLPTQFKRGVGNVTADEEALHHLEESTTDRKSRRVIKGILAARGARKFWKTYGAISERVYPRYSPTAKESDAGGRKTVAATGRILARGDRDTSTPPIQQIPRQLRKLFLPEPGHLFVQGDWKQQELRLIAQFSGARFILDNLDRKPDLFTILGERYGCDRVRAKNLFYGLWAFGGSARTGQHALGARGFRITLKECERFIADGRSLVPEIFTWHARTYELARKDRMVRNPFGRVRKFHSVKDSYNEILNFPVQSTGADMLWSVLKPVDLAAQSVGGELKILVHDSICCSIPEQNAERFGEVISTLMGREFAEVAPGFRVPVDLKIGKTWGEVS